MSNKTLQILSITFFVIYVLGQVSIFFDIDLVIIDRRITNLSIIFFQILALSLLLKTGSLIKSKFFKFTLILGFLFLFSMLFKIMHWPFSNIMYLTAISGLIVIYLIHFSSKKNRKRLDYIKLMWVIVILPLQYLMAIHYLSKGFKFISPLILFVAVLELAVLEKKYRAENKLGK